MAVVIAAGDATAATAAAATAVVAQVAVAVIVVTVFVVSRQQQKQKEYQQDEEGGGRGVHSSHYHCFCTCVTCIRNSALLCALMSVFARSAVGASIAMTIHAAVKTTGTENAVHLDFLNMFSAVAGLLLPISRGMFNCKH